MTTNNNHCGRVFTDSLSERGTKPLLAAETETCVVSTAMKATFLCYISTNNIRDIYLSYTRHRLKRFGE